MALNTVTTGNTILAADVNQLVQVLQRQSGQTETGKYAIVGNSYVNGGNIHQYTNSLSRGSTPVSVSIDTADFTNTMSAPSTTGLTANGFRCVGSSTAITASCGCGGNYTIQY